MWDYRKMLKISWMDKLINTGKNIRRKAVRVQLKNEMYE